MQGSWQQREEREYRLPQLPMQNSMSGLSEYTRPSQPPPTLLPPLPPKESLQDRPLPSGLPLRPREISPTRNRPANPLTDLITTETAYVDSLAGIIKRVAGSWSRTNFPPRALDRMFRSIEGCYRINKSLLGRLNDIGPSPSSPKALGDLLMRWIDDIEPAYRNYAESFRCSFDTFAPVQSNPNLHPVLNSMPEGQQSLDALFFLPNARLHYYKKLYTKLLRSTEEGRSDHRLLSDANAKIDDLIGLCAATIDVPAVDDEETPTTGATDITTAEPSPDKSLPPEPPLSPKTPTANSNDLPQRQPRGSSFVAPSPRGYGTPPRSPSYAPVSQQPASSPRKGHFSNASQATITSSGNASNSVRGSGSATNSINGSGSTSESGPSSRATSWDSRRPDSEVQRTSSQLSQEVEIENEVDSSCGGASLESAATLRTPNKRVSSVTSNIRIANIDQLERELDTSETLDIFTMRPKKCRLQINPPSLPFSRQILRHADVALSFHLSAYSIQQRQNMPENDTTELYVQKAHIFLLTDLFLICEYRFSPDGRLALHLLFPPLAGKHLRVQPVEEDVDNREFDIIVMKREVLSIQCPNQAERERWLQVFEQCITHGSQVNLKVTTNMPENSGTSPANQTHALQNGAIYSPISSGARSPGISDDGRYNSPINIGRPPSAQAYNNRPQNQLHPQTARSAEQQRSFSGPASSSAHYASQQMNGRYRSPSPNQQQQRQQQAMYESNFPAGMNGNSGPSNGNTRLDQPFDPMANNGLARRLTASSLPPGAAPPRPSSNGYPQSSNGYPQNTMTFPLEPPSQPFRPHDRNSAPFHPTVPSFDSPPAMVKEASRSMGSLRDYARQQPMPMPPPMPRYSGAHMMNSQRGMLMSASTRNSSRMSSRNNADDDDSPPPTPRDASQTTNQVIATMKCKVFLQTSHQQWKSLGTSKLTLYLQSPGNIKQLVVQSESGSKATIISTIILTDGVERVGKTGVAIELSDKGARTGIVYMLQLKTEQSALGFYKELLAGSSRQSAAA